MLRLKVLLFPLPPSLSCHSTPTPKFCPLKWVGERFFFLRIPVSELEFQSFFLFGHQLFPGVLEVSAACGAPLVSFRSESLFSFLDRTARCLVLLGPLSPLSSFFPALFPVLPEFDR